METISLDDIKQDAIMGLRAKGSSIFYSCNVLSVSGDKITLSVPAFRDPALETMRKVELRIINDSGEYEATLYNGTVYELFTDYMEVRIASRQKHEERRKNIRIPCELRIRYMELKNPEETWYTTYSLNMSPGGIKMYSSRFHQEGEYLLFQFYIPEGYSTRSLLVRGAVMKIKKMSDINFNQQAGLKGQSYRKYIVNVCFEGLSPADYLGLTRYIYSNTR
ncbi:MAG: hypothetical protein JL50_08040 [Peptococcaceae bacterium BICA1-7]|nr:MAG: hypothetical protein JL50_08040 [Peptococcaceae bacterium BICA1-7]HBV97491.1 PilZ domain-containing protein [Desulfotomaculum sp.]